MEMLYTIFGKPKTPPPQQEEAPPSPAVVAGDKSFMPPQPDAPALTASTFDKLFGEPQGNS